MNVRVILPTVLILFLCSLVSSFAQSGFSVEAYRKFLQDNQKLSAEQLTRMYPAGNFRDKMPVNFSDALYSDSIDHHFNLAAHEKSLIDRHGFMVTERLTYPSFGHAYHDIYIKDLPVFVSTDAILHALHKSYDAILVDLEYRLLSYQLNSLLDGLHAQLPALAARYNDPRMKVMLNDVDIYLTVARTLLNFENFGPTTSVFAENRAAVEELLTLVRAEQPGSYPLFATIPRTIDFSQFTTRGHYTQSEELGNYFKAMIWLGRTEIYLGSTKGSQNPPSPEDIQRQTIVAALIAEAARDGNLLPLLDEIDATLEFLIGESDNVKLENILDLMTGSYVANASVLLDTMMLKNFQNNLAAQPYAEQKILSQILIGGGEPDAIAPAPSFLLLGQRFVIDSYVLGNVVHDKVQYRMLPSSLDMLFALGNDAALQLLEPELKKFEGANYPRNLAGLRYLIDSYDSTFWNSTLYTGWLNSIRTLAPPDDRSHLPAFMQTAAWWQQKMNTQLSAWAQLRHDNLLYAKQSYSGGIGCSYPESLVEPIPEFYDAVARYARRGSEVFEKISFRDEYAGPRVVGYFKNMEKTMTTLGAIARKELADASLTDDEKSFLRTMISRETVGCGVIVYNGWYPDLFFKGVSDEAPVIEEDMVVADVHTAPTDEFGAPVGWVMHVGTGPINIAVVTCQMPDGKSVAFVGPVMSYYEHTSTNFKRLTDEEWKSAYNASPSLRPAWTNIYLAGKEGDSRGEIYSLTTGVDKENEKENGADIQVAQSYPNPFDASATISFSIAPSLSGEEVEVIIADVNGKVVARPLRRQLPSGSYMVRWDGTDDAGKKVSDGVYFYSVTAGEKQAGGTMTLISTGR